MRVKTKLHRYVIEGILPLDERNRITTGQNDQIETFLLGFIKFAVILMAIRKSVIRDFLYAIIFLDSEHVTYAV